jgi:hypothetical protein
MQEKSAPAAIAHRRQSLHVSMAAKVDRGGVSQEEEMPAAVCPSLSPMRFRDGAKGDAFGIHQSICGPAIGPGFGLFGSTSAGIGGEPRGHFDGPLGTPLASQVTSSKLCFRPTIEIQLQCPLIGQNRGDDHLLVVVLGSTSSDARYVDARNLFRWSWRQREQK